MPQGTSLYKMNLSFCVLIKTLSQSVEKRVICHEIVPMVVVVVVAAVVVDALRCGKLECVDFSFLIIMQ